MTPEQTEVVERERADEALRDGIGEEDHAIPFWFNATFGATIVFAVVYIAWHQASDWTQAARYQEEISRFEASAAQLAAERPQTNPYRGDAAGIAEGEQVFASICAVCHKPDGTGMVGPSLVDPYWKYGHGDAELFETVAAGRPLGMPPWGAQLGDEKIWKVLAYLETLPKHSEPGLGAPGATAPGAAAAPAAAGS